MSMLMIWRNIELVESILLLIMLGLDMYIFNAHTKKIKSLEDNVKRLSRFQRALDNHTVNIESRVYDLEKKEEQ